jgi:hypothetical protein
VQLEINVQARGIMEDSLAGNDVVRHSFGQISHIVLSTVDESLVGARATGGLHTFEGHIRE